MLRHIATAVLKSQLKWFEILIQWPFQTMASGILRRPAYHLGHSFRRMFSVQPVKFGNDIPGYIAGDKGKPAVILVQEWWGVTDGIKEKAVKLAEKGNYRVLVPDLYKGKVGVDVEEASHMMGALDFPNAVKEIQEAASFLKSEGAWWEIMNQTSIKNPVLQYILDMLGHIWYQCISISHLALESFLLAKVAKR